MKKSENAYEPHLIIREFSILPGGEWTPRCSGWSVIHVREGTGYHLQPPLNRELETGALLVTATNAPGSIRASQLGGMALCSFKVIPSRLTGLITLGEQHFFETTTREPRLFSSRHPVAMRMGQLCAERSRGGLLFRLQLLEIFAEMFGDEVEQTPSVEQSTDARKRLQDFLEQTPSSELLEMSFGDLAQKTHCTSRHLSRIFHELTGMSFRDKRAELRLARARELLATTDSKVVDVAMESGYKSLSLFNLMFARHFGMSPGRWRKQQVRQVAEKRLPNRKLRTLASTALAPMTFAQPSQPKALSESSAA